MFLRRQLPKRLVALCGIALTAVGCFHQAHGFCRVTGCEQPAGAASVATSDRCVEGCFCPCCPPRLASRSGNQTSEVLHSGPNSPGCPNSETCVCCQTQPTPAQSSPIDAELLASAPLLYVAPRVAIVAPDSRVGEWSVNEADVASAGSLATCARLCRFLA
jgi:hypothetical protein